MIPNTIRHTGGTYVHAVCEITDGEKDTNGILESGGTLGFVNAVWITAEQGTSVQLPACQRP